MHSTRVSRVRPVFASCTRGCVCVCGPARALRRLLCARSRRTVVRAVRAVVGAKTSACLVASVRAARGSVSAVRTVSDTWNMRF